MSSSANAQGARVLVVEDDPTNATLIQDYLEAQGFEVTIAEESSQGLDRFAAIDPAIVIADVLLPGQTGFEFVRALRARPGGARVPVIMMSAVWKDAYPEQPEPGEVQAYLVKPFRMSDLADRIRELLG